MNRLTYKAVFLMMVLFTTSCYEDILEKAPLDRMSDALVWTNQELMEQFLITQYGSMPVFVHDATVSQAAYTTCAPFVRDPRRGDALYIRMNSAEISGPQYVQALTDETAPYMNRTVLFPVKQNGINYEGYVMEWWENAYYTIRCLNEFIEKAPVAPVSTEVWVAEARFLRAYCYFAMVKRYGAVPLITQVVQLDSPEELLYPKRNSEKDIYDFILSETEAIAPLLPAPDKAIWGRASRYAALALHCRAALYAGSIAQFGQVALNGLLGFPSGEANAYYQKAVWAAKEVMDGTYSLYEADADKVENFKNIFLKKKNTEAIFVVEHGGNGMDDGGFGTWSWDVNECPMPQVWQSANSSAPYLEMVEEFEYTDGRPGTIDRDAIQQGLWTMDELWQGRDPRFYASVWTCGSSWENAEETGAFPGGGKIDMHDGIILPDGSLMEGSSVNTYNDVPSWGQQTLNSRGRPGFGIMKYLDPNANNMKWLVQSTTDYQVFRYAEILLSYAEAQFELGETGEALNAVNQIRKRAGILQLTSIDREKICHERKVELAFENHRYWDLRRWRIAREKLSREYSGIQYILDYNTRKFKIVVKDNIEGGSCFFPESNYYFPITRRRTDQNPNLLPENPGY